MADHPVRTGPESRGIPAGETHGILHTDDAGNECRLGHCSSVCLSGHTSVNDSHKIVAFVIRAYDRTGLTGVVLFRIGECLLLAACDKDRSCNQCGGIVCLER